MNLLYAAIDRYGDGYLDDSSFVTFRTLNDAVAYRDAQSDPELTVIFGLDEIPHWAMWDWATRRIGSDEQPMMYVNERAARNSCPRGYEVLKRRKGTDAWLPGGAS